MEYIEYKIEFEPSLEVEIKKEIAIADLADLGFDSFDEQDQIVLAYILEDAEKANFKDIETYTTSIKGAKSTRTKVETVNWNKEWESNFDPIDVDGICTIRAPFHEKSTSKHEIIIMPKMSFGTGHHATTHLMVRSIFDSGLKGKSGLDMGSGTGVLAIAAIKNGAAQMDCVDIDQWAYENCIENCQTNGVEAATTPILGGASVLKGKKYDFILANINRNILINDLPTYISTLNQGGQIRMSGFLEFDIDDIKERGEELGLKFISSALKDGWATVLMAKC